MTLDASRDTVEEACKAVSVTLSELTSILSSRGLAMNADKTLLCHQANTFGIFCDGAPISMVGLKRSFRQLSPHARRLDFMGIIQPDLEYSASVFFPTKALTVARLAWMSRTIDDLVTAMSHKSSGVVVEQLVSGMSLPTRMNPK